MDETKQEKLQFLAVDDQSGRGIIDPRGCRHDRACTAAGCPSRPPYVTHIEKILQPLKSERHFTYFQ